MESSSERGAGKNKRKWTDLENEKLIEALLELVNDGTFKENNGFKPGYLSWLETKLQEKFPGSGIKAKPPIESRIKTLKGDFNTVHDLRFGSNSSGFGWDAERHLVTAPKDVWTAYTKVHNAVTKWKNTILPWFDDLSTIFGKDRATGHGAVSGQDVIKNLDVAQESENSLPAVNDDDLSIQQSTYSDESINRSNSKKKQKMDPMVQVVYDASKIIVTQFEAATKMFIVSEKENAEKIRMENVEQMKKINEELDNICGITLMQKFQAAKKLAEDENLLALLFDEDKSDLVDAMIHGVI